MSAQSNVLREARIVSVMREKRASGFYFATSKDLEGLVVSAKTMRELDERIPEVISRMYGACGVKVIVTWVDAPARDQKQQLVAVPADIARRELDKAATANVATAA